MDFASKTTGDTLYLTALERRIDAAGSVEFKEAMRSRIVGAPDNIVLDLQHVEFIDSSGLGALVAMLKFVSKDRRMSLAGLQPSVQGLFRLTRLDTVFTIDKGSDDMQRMA